MYIKRIQNLLLALIVTVSTVTVIAPQQRVGAIDQPTVPPAQICGNSSYLDGPSTAPVGAVVVPAGDNSALTPNWNGSGFSQQNKTFWFAPGVHYVGDDQFAQIIPGSGSTYIGAPGAIIDGQSINEKAFTGTANNVTIKYLTIRNFQTPHDQGAVNGDAGSGWVVSNNTMTMNNGAAIFGADNGTISYNCLKDNGQYGFQTAGGSSNIFIDHNEVSGNNAANTEQTAGIENCGCSGGAKFWDSREVTVTNNYVHDNKGAGLWADTINVGFLIEGNWIENNDGEGIYMEVSYNFHIKNNVLIHNGTVFGPNNPGFPTGAIYISESGSDSRVTTPTNNFNITSDISGNLFKDNWGGVALWENSNRFCSNGLPTVECTLVDPATITVESCETNLADPTKNQPGMSPDYFNDCRWRTQNVKVFNNTFTINPADVGPDCNVGNSCGVNALMSVYGSNTPYTSSIIGTNVAFEQNNTFYDNVYLGPWYFWPWNQSNTAYPVSFADWQKPVTDKCLLPSQISSGTCNSGFGQDVGSTLGTLTELPVYRMANWMTKERLFTLNANERNTIKDRNGWVYEGVAFYVPTGGSVPVYRMANWMTKERLFTLSSYERDFIKDKNGWVYEGVAFKVN